MTSRVLGFLPNENVNEQRGIANRGAASKSALLFLRVDRAQGACGLASQDGPCVKDTWAKMADRDILDVRVTAAPFLQGSGCQKGSIVWNVIHCKFYTEEIYVIKTVSNTSNDKFD